ncbi:MAG: hypothetical protein R3E39_13360 [Anaerolineae bacterium]
MTAGRQPLSDAEITGYLQDLVGWTRAGDKLEKVFNFPAYTDGLIFATWSGPPKVESRKRRYTEKRETRQWPE